MDRYDDADDQYCYSGTSVLKNKLGILQLDELEAAERDITAVTHRAIRYAPPPYSLEFLQRIQFALFSELYEWAGKLREVDISKGSTRFCTHSRIRPEAENRFNALAEDSWLAGLKPDVFCEKLAEHYCELNMIHPFREGNGRVQRIFFEQLALGAGFVLDWSRIDSQRWLQANVDGVRVDYRAMRDVFLRIATAR